MSLRDGLPRSIHALLWSRTNIRKCPATHAGSPLIGCPIRNTRKQTGKCLGSPPDQIRTILGVFRKNVLVKLTHVLSGRGWVSLTSSAARFNAPYESGLSHWEIRTLKRASVS